MSTQTSGCGRITEADGDKVESAEFERDVIVMFFSGGRLFEMGQHVRVAMNSRSEILRRRCFIVSMHSCLGS